mgnify:FL=1
MCNSKHNCANIIFSFLLALIVCLAIPFIFIPAGEWPNFEQHDCHVERIVYPTELPTSDNTTGWAECDCGKYCTTWSPCIQIFTNVSDNVFVLPEFYYIHGQCTFHNSSCPEGEDITTVLEELAKAQEIFEEYNDRNLTCYYDNHISYIFLNKEWDWGQSIVFIVFVTIITTILIVMNTCSYCEERKKKREAKVIENPAFKA